MNGPNETPQQAARRLAASAIRDGYIPEALHEYTGPDASVWYWRIRLKNPHTGEKWIRPMRLNGAGLELGEPDFPDGKPIYRLHDLTGRPDDPVIVVEGEICVDSLAKAGALATTSGAADSAAKADWRPLAGRDVTIWPDNDEAGQRYADAVADALRALGCTVRVIDVEKLGLLSKGDVVDWLLANPAATAADIAALPCVEATNARARETNEQAVARLASMKPMDYDRVRQAEADALGVRIATLDAEVARARAALNPAGDDAALQGQAVAIDEPEPWPDEVDGAEVLNDTTDALTMYLALPDGAADAMALWVAHAHCHTAFLHSPRLNITAPEKGCGKTLTLDVLHCLVPKAIRTEGITTAVLFRLVDKYAPTLLVDEYDAFIHDNEELRGALNAGHKRGGMHLRCEGEKNEVRGFRTFAPVALAGIRELPGTLADRSIVVHMQRIAPTERRKPFDSRRTDSERELCRKLAKWTRFQSLESADPELPAGAVGRVADNWRPLFAIAAAAGGDWPKRVRQAFDLIGKPGDEVMSRSVLLLGDFRALFHKHGDWLLSTDVARHLAEMEERPWPEYRDGKPITVRQIAALLRPLRIKPKLARVGTVGRGYSEAEFIDAFTRYLPQDDDPDPSPGDPPSDPLHRYNVGGARVSEDLDPLHGAEAVTDRKPPEAKQDAGCNGVTDRDPPTQGEGEGSDSTHGGEGGRRVEVEV